MWRIRDVGQGQESWHVIRQPTFSGGSALWLTYRDDDHEQRSLTLSTLSASRITYELQISLEPWILANQGMNRLNVPYNGLTESMSGPNHNDRASVRAITSASVAASLPAPLLHSLIIPAFTFQVTLPAWYSYVPNDWEI